MKTKFLKLRYLRQRLGDLERSQGVVGGGGALLSSQKQACQMFFSADRCGWGSAGPERVFLGHSHSPTERTVLGPWVPGRCVSNSMKTVRHPAPRRERGQRDGAGGSGEPKTLSRWPPRSEIQNLHCIWNHEHRILTVWVQVKLICSFDFHQ